MLTDHWKNRREASIQRHVWTCELASLFLLSYTQTHNSWLFDSKLSFSICKNTFCLDLFIPLQGISTIDILTFIQQNRAHSLMGAAQICSSLLLALFWREGVTVFITISHTIKLGVTFVCCTLEGFQIWTNFQTWNTKDIKRNLIDLIFILMLKTVNTDDSAKTRVHALDVYTKLLGLVWKSRALRCAMSCTKS